MGISDISDLSLTDTEPEPEPNLFYIRGSDATSKLAFLYDLFTNTNGMKKITNRFILVKSISSMLSLYI